METSNGEKRGSRIAEKHKQHGKDDNQQNRAR
jgi:hypothetical protein